VRVVVRWLLRHTILFLVEEWDKARIDAWAARSVHRVEAATSAEVAKLRVSLANVERMHREAARTMTRVPAAQDVIVRLLEERLAGLVQAAHEVVIEEREAA
jgi:hypothetical protein